MAGTRAAACRCVLQVWQDKQSLAECLPTALQKVEPRDRGFLQALVYQTIRHFQELDALTRQALSKPLKKKDLDIHCLIMVGLCQQRFMATPDHAAVDSTVEATRLLKKHWAKGLVNAILRKSMRGELTLPDQDTVRWNHPRWLIEALRKAWPEHWQAILEANQQPGPMTLRLDPGAGPREAWLTRLEAAGLSGQPTAISPCGVKLTDACDVHTLPGFDEGLVSVQDEAAQMAAYWLAPQAGERILDACAAPGGKTGHILELMGPAGQEQGEVVALDANARRLTLVEDNLQRLQRRARLVHAAAEDTAAWWDGQPFDRILLDVPCSGTGVIRRHPDIKLLRQAQDISALVDLQARILDATWQTLKPGGVLLYATCSVLPEENRDQIARFLDDTPDAEVAGLSLEGLAATHGLPDPFGEQWLPRIGGADGFYYARLRKREDSQLNG